MSAICDFCSSPDVQWSYPARDFEVTGIPLARRAGSSGGWAACPVCHVLIERGDRVRLAHRSAKRMARRYGVSVNSIERELRSLHDQFWASREGPPTRYEPAAGDGAIEVG